jgi:dienelactone hydrolase
VDDVAAQDDSGEPVAATIDASSLPVDEAACVSDASAVYFIDLEAEGPSAARLPCRSDARKHGNKSRPLVAVGPARGLLLAEGHRYAAVLTSRLKDATGHHVARSADFARIASGTRSGAIATLYGAAIDGANRALASALATDGAEIVSIAPFTTSNMTRELFALHDGLATAKAPSLAWDAAAVAPMGATRFARVTPGGALPQGFTASLDAWLGVVDPAAKLADGSDDPDGARPVRAHDKIAAMGTAVYEGTNFLQTKPGAYDALDHATFAHDASGAVVPDADHPTAKIWATFVVPTAPMPAAGYPTVIVQHGLNGSRAYLLQLANVIASHGWMAVAIDSVTFGARAPEAKYQVDATSDYASAPGATYSGPDGISDVVGVARNGSSDLFGGLKNIGAIRDQMRQAGFDTTQLVKVLTSSPDLSALAAGGSAPKVDADRIAYVGDSLGAMEGAIAAALEPKVKAWTLNVVGGGLFPELAAHSPSISANLVLAGGFNFGFQGDRFTESHPLVTIAQTIVDPGDPIAYAPYLVRAPAKVGGAAGTPRNVLQIQCLFDEVVPNEANEAFARAAGFKLATPNVGSNAGILDIKHPATNPGRLPLESVAAGSDGAIRATPSADVTAVVVQQSPAAHGSDMVNSKGHHSFAIPFATFDAPQSFTTLDQAKQFDVTEDYAGVQSLMTRFFGEAFDGKVPSVGPFKAPVRDFDGDGRPDEVDDAPSDPTR